MDVPKGCTCSNDVRCVHFLKTMAAGQCRDNTSKRQAMCERSGGVVPKRGEKVIC